MVRECVRLICNVSATLLLQGSITGPAIYQFQQVEEARPLFWESLLLFIGLAESFRVAVGWATPTGNGFNNLKARSLIAAA